MNSEIINWLNNNFGYNISTDYYNNISVWKDWWKGFHEPFHRITFENGEKRKSRDMYTMKMAKKVCEDWASILINDKTFVKVDDEYSEKFIVGDTDNGGVFGSNNFWDQANDLMEKMMYSGTCAIVIRLKNAVVSFFRSALSEVLIKASDSSPRLCISVCIFTSLMLLTAADSVSIACFLFTFTLTPPFAQTQTTRPF